MSLFGGGDEGEDSEETTTDSVEAEEETVEVTVTREKEYTEHEGVAKFVNGDEVEWTFDSMKRDHGEIVLKNYTGYVPRTLTMGGFKGGFQKEAIVTIMTDQLRYFETVERTKQTLEYETTVEKPKSEVEE